MVTGAAEPQAFVPATALSLSLGWNITRPWHPRSGGATQQQQQQQDQDSKPQQQEQDAPCRTFEDFASCRSSGEKLQRSKSQGLGLGSFIYLAGPDAATGVIFVAQEASVMHSGVPL